MPGFPPVRLLCALLCASVPPAQAATLHVAPGGSDNNAKVGDTLPLAAGNHAGSGNQAQGGGAVNAFLVNLTDCMFTGNEASGPDAFGGAIASGGKAMLVDCILWDDTAPSGGEIGEATSGSPSLSTAYCDIQGGQSGPGDTKSDPRFSSTTDLHLGSGSPCRRAGTTIPGVITDADKKPRSAPPSIGAHE